MGGLESRSGGATQYVVQNRSLWFTFNAYRNNRKLGDLKMNPLLLAKSAEKLEQILRHYLTFDREVLRLFDALSRLISDARTGRILGPMEWRDIPGGYDFTEGGLGKYSDLEAAYAEFKIEITGGESPVLRSLRLNAASKS